MSDDVSSRQATSRDTQHDRGFKCGKCGEPMFFKQMRKGSTGSPVADVTIYECENGHCGKRNFGYDGYLTQSMGIQYPEGL